MAERRTLVEGLQTPEPPLDPVKAQEFLYAKSRRPKPPANTTAAASPLSTRIRTDFAVALKRASLERQLNGPKPYTLRDILEEAIEPWLRSNGYLS